MNSIELLDQIIFCQAGPILAAKYGPPEPNLDDQNVPPIPFFDQDQNFHYNTCQTTVTKCMNARIKQQASSQLPYTWNFRSMYISR